FTAVAMFGIVIVAGYFLYAMQRTLFGEYRLETDYTVGRAAVHDIVPLAVLVVLVIVLGTAPNIFFDMITDAVGPMLGGGLSMAPLPDWTAAAPAILLGLTAIALLIIDSISPRSKNRNLLAGTTLVGTLAALAAAVG